MKSLVRARKYPDDALGAYFWLNRAISYLNFEFRRADIYRCLSLAEAISIIERAKTLIAIETNNETGRQVFHL